MTSRSPAGLNPKGCRAMRQPRRRELYNTVRGFHDGDLALSFPDLGVAQKAAIANRLQASFPALSRGTPRGLKVVSLLGNRKV